MTQKEYDALKDLFVKEALAVETAKRPDYTIGDADVLANFKRVGERLGLTPEQALLVYALKHEDAITKIMRNPTAPTSEPILYRFIDRFNYLTLGLGLLVDRGVDIGATPTQLVLPL